MTAVFTQEVTTLLDNAANKAFELSHETTGSIHFLWALYSVDASERSGATEMQTMLNSLGTVDYNVVKDEIEHELRGIKRSFLSVGGKVSLSDELTTILDLSISDCSY